MEIHKALGKFLDGYLQTAVPIETVLEQAPAPDACLECSDIVQVDVSCQTAGCKRKRTKECATEMCFQCCFALKTSCSAHFRMRKKREEEDQYIEDGRTSSTRKTTSFYHYEEKFMKSDQTVVVWCLQDFLQRPEWSADTLEQHEREQRAHQLLNRRGSSQASDLSRLSHTSATSPSASTSAAPSSVSSSPRSASSSVGRGSRLSAAVSAESENQTVLEAEAVGSPQASTASKGKRGRKSATEEAVFTDKEKVKEEVIEEEEGLGIAKSARARIAVASVAKRGASGKAVGSLRVTKRAAILGRKRRFEQVQEEWNRLLGV